MMSDKMFATLFTPHKGRHNKSTSNCYDNLNSGAGPSARFLSPQIRHLSRQKVPRGNRVWRNHATLRKTTQVLLPPNPKELETAMLMGCSRAWLATWHSAQSGSGSSRLMV